MITRSSKSMVTFDSAFAQPGYQGQLPAGTYEVIVDEELLQGLSFEAWRRTATYLIVHGSGGDAGSSTMRLITQKDLKTMQRRDRCTTEAIRYSEAALSPLED